MGAGGPVTSLRVMSWYWRLHDASGGTVDPVSVDVEMPESGSQSDAESWLGENWRHLLSRGVATVTLVDGDTEAYGPMSLAEQ